VSHLTGEARATYVRRMFARIAGRYDLLNRLMTLGQDVRWRRESVRHLDPPDRGRVLDIGAGTGDLAFEVQRQYPGVRAVAADFTAEMIAVGRRRARAESVEWVVADATHLPFPDATFSGVISGFLLRNLGDLDASIAEQQRVLLAAGRFVSLDTTPPPAGMLSPLIRFHLHTIIPTLGRVLAGDAEAYRYLPDSTERFTDAEGLADKLTEGGMTGVGFVRRMFGTVAIHWASKHASG
jgi:demethylmenaquinone methyltransferase / 2-methoxy-6-polyprenyl-1,4-benzoquinol methylase